MATEIADQEVTVDVTDDLDAFEQEFFGTTKSEEITPDDTPAVIEGEDEEANTDEPASDEDNADEVDEEAHDDEPEADKDDDGEDDEETDLFKVKRKKSAGERIRELTAARRESERREAILREENERLKSGAQKEEPKAKPAADLGNDAPDPDEQLDDGAQKYPLGEFDPKYIRDLTKFTIAQETAAARTREAEERQAAQMQEAETALHTQWTEKVASVDPEVKQALEASVPALEDTFRDIHPDYGKYLASTIMAMDHGPEVLHYLASNIGEAKKIVSSGPTAATIALGRIEARFDIVKEQKQKVRATAAPTPPPTNRGAGGKFSVTPDTDDLDAFEKAFYKKR